MLHKLMRLIAISNLKDFWTKHPEAESSLKRWIAVVKSANWQAMSDVQSALPKSKVLNGERIRFEVSGGNYRLIAAFDFGRKLVFVKFIGTHAEYDRIDAMTVAQF
jgi:mRNA interferase HigB